MTEFKPKTDLVRYKGNMPLKNKFMNNSNNSKFVVEFAYLDQMENCDRVPRSKTYTDKKHKQIHDIIAFEDAFVSIGCQNFSKKNGEYSRFGNAYKDYIEPYPEHFYGENFNGVCDKNMKFIKDKGAKPWIGLKYGIVKVICAKENVALKIEKIVRTWKKDGFVLLNRNPETAEHYIIN